MITTSMFPISGVFFGRQKQKLHAKVFARDVISK
jgi:hypothetical protein